MAQLDKLEIHTPDLSYKPQNDPVYMSEQMLFYFQDKLIRWEKACCN